MIHYIYVLTMSSQTAIRDYFYQRMVGAVKSSQGQQPQLTKEVKKKKKNWHITIKVINGKTNANLNCTILTFKKE